MHEITELYKAIDRGCIQSISAHFTYDACYFRPGYRPLKSREEIIAFYKRGRIIERGEHKVCQLVGDHFEIAVWGEFNGVSKSGQTLKEQFADFFEMRDGQVRNRRTFFARPAI